MGDTSVLFVGESWRGSCARSLREAMQRVVDSDIDDLSEDVYLPSHNDLVIRAVSRATRPWQIRALERAILDRVRKSRPHALLVYKGFGVSENLVARVRAQGVATVNVFPDHSPNSYGTRLYRALGRYDLVISTKAHHPDSWFHDYGLSNRCVFVPHGYDPSVHLWNGYSSEEALDIVLAATWRPEYETLMLDLERELHGSAVSVGIIGNGWRERRQAFPPDWQVDEARSGRAYASWLRKGRIVIAPVNSKVVVAGRSQPGDQDTTRTYELAAANCFFVHQRTPYVQTIFDEHTEVPMWGDARELAALVRRFLPQREVRGRLADAAHRRAVPAYSIDCRARQVYQHVQACVEAVR